MRFSPSILTSVLYNCCFFNFCLFEPYRPLRFPNKEAFIYIFLAVRPPVHLLPAPRARAPDRRAPLLAIPTRPRNNLRGGQDRHPPQEIHAARHTGECNGPAKSYKKFFNEKTAQLMSQKHSS